MSAGDDAATAAPDPLLARQVEAMAGLGVPAESIALVIGIDRKTLERDYGEELSGGAVKTNVKVGGEPVPQGDRRRPASGRRGDLLAEDPRRLEGDHRARARRRRRNAARDRPGDRRPAE